MYSDERAIRAAAKLIRDGRVVVFPTETVYGLGANALDANAVGRIYEAKGRPADNPLIVHLGTPDDAGRVAAEITPTARRLLEEFAPGPLTVVLPVHRDLPRIVTAGLDTVAVRIPSHPVAAALIAQAGVPIAAPSANRSGEPSPTTVEMARRSLGDAPAAYLDGGPCEVGLESTVVSIHGDEVRVLRPGAVTEADLLAAIPGALVTSAAAPAGAAGPAPSPGLRHRHYRPRAHVRLFASVSELGELLESASLAPPLGLIVPDSMQLPVAARDATEVRAYNTPTEYARWLYAWFSEMDRRGVSTIIAHLPPAEGLGAALRDRLKRASGEL
jgi:L-threonylcarbamoyladenylate synthase